MTIIIINIIMTITIININEIPAVPIDGTTNVIGQIVGNKVKKMSLI